MDNLIEFVYPVSFICAGGLLGDLPWEKEVPPTWEEKALEAHIEDTFIAQRNWDSFPEPTPVIDEWENLSEDEELEALRGLGLLPEKIVAVPSTWEKIVACSPEATTASGGSSSWSFGTEIVNTLAAAAGIIGAFVAPASVMAFAIIEHEALPHVGRIIYYLHGLPL